MPKLENQIYTSIGLEFLDKLDNFVISHVYREGNALVDYLSNSACVIGEVKFSRNQECL